MKVKNIVFSGVMAAILGATSANAAAISVASQGYVDSKVKANADAITEITKTDGTIDTKVAAAVAPLATAESVTNLAGTVETHGTDIAGLKQADIDLAADIQSNSDAIALLTGGSEGEGKLQELTDQINSNAAAIETLTADAATKDSVAYDIAEALKVYSTTEQVDAKDATTLQSAQGYADGLNTAMDTRVDALEGAGYQNATQVGDAIDAEIAALNLGGTYQTKGNLSTKIVEDAASAEKYTSETAVVDYVDDKFTELNGSNNALSGRVDTVESLADANEKAINAINNETTGILATAKTYAEGQASTAQAAAEATAAGALEAAMANIAAAYLEKPAECATTYCVLSVTGKGENESITWMPLTEPQSEYYPAE